MRVRHDVIFAKDGTPRICVFRLLNGDSFVGTAEDKAEIIVVTGRYYVASAHNTSVGHIPLAGAIIAKEMIVAYWPFEKSPS